MPDEIVLLDPNGAYVWLPVSYAKADAEANDFFALWDHHADDSTLIRFIRKMSPLAFAIVEVRFKQRDRLQAQRTDVQNSAACRTAENGGDSHEE
jgi:NAD-dependent oxidoreductase involved in siderophore biosynthesis